MKERTRKAARSRSVTGADEVHSQISAPIVLLGFLAFSLSYASAQAQSDFRAECEYEARLRISDQPYHDLMARHAATRNQPDQPIGSEMARFGQLQEVKNRIAEARAQYASNCALAKRRSLALQQQQRDEAARAAAKADNDNVERQVRAFFERYPDARIHEHEIAAAIAEDRSLGLDAAYFRVRSFYMREGLDWSKDLRANLEEREREKRGVTDNKPGMIDTSVQHAQRMLLALGYDIGLADGILGERTRAAIVAYQRKEGMSPTGNVSAELMQNLKASTLK